MNYHALAAGRLALLQKFVICQRRFQQRSLIYQDIFFQRRLQQSVKVGFSRQHFFKDLFSK
jgi:hypothetical protein